VPQRTTFGAEEDRRARIVSGDGAWVLAESRDDHPGDANGAAPDLGFGGPRIISPVERSAYPYGARRQVEDRRELLIAKSGQDDDLP
jgi:hypothetical protein